MSNTPFNKQTLSKAGTLGMSLGIGGIVLFIVSWVALGSMGVEQIPRLMIALCLPPALIAGAIGGYMLLVPPR